MTFKQNLDDLSLLIPSFQTCHGHQIKEPVCSSQHIYFIYASIDQIETNIPKTGPKHFAEKGEINQLLSVTG